MMISGKIEMKLLIVIVLVVGCIGCQHAPIKRATLPATATMGVNLDKLSKSLGSAQANVSATKSKLSEIDDKAVRIESAIRNW